MALKLDILANTRQFVSEMKKSGASVEEISEALDELIRDGDKAGDKLERSFKDLAKSAKKAETAVEKVGTDGFKKASKGADDFKDEANSTAREVAASFDGSAESIAGGFQEVAANALSGFGPAGAAAGLALAAGIGIATSAFSAMGEQSEALKEQVKQNFRDMAEEGIAAWESVQSQNERLTEAYVEHEDEIRKIADTVGVTFEVVASAWAGNREAIELVRAAQRDHLAELEEGGTVAEKAIVSGITRPLEDTIRTYDIAKERVAQLEDQIAESEKGQRDQIQRTRDAAQERYEALANRQVTLKVGIDDGALRRYVPPPIYVKVRGVDERGRILF